MMNFTDINADLTGVTHGSTVAEDFDGDGDTDILLTGATDSSFSNKIAKVYINDGNSNFTENTANSITGVYNSSVAAQDYDGDGDSDVLITGSTGDNFIAKIYDNDGSGSFTENTNTNLHGVTSSSVVMEDYDNDNDIDILLTGFYISDYAKIYDNDGNGNFFENTTSNLTAVSSGTLTVEDLDGDNDLDIILTGDDGSNRITKIYDNDGTGNFSENTNVDLHDIAGGSVAAEDFDGDGDLDILLSGYDGSNRITKIYDNNGTGNFIEDSNNLIGVSSGSVATGDFDGDNDLDILISGYDGSSLTTKIYGNDGIGNFTEDTTINLPGIHSGEPQIEDFDGDNDLDILITGWDGNNPITKIYRNDTINQIDGTSGNDSLRGTIISDFINGGAGRDTIKGNDGNDIINGQADTDYLYGEAGNDTLNGGDSYDYFYPGAGNDSVVGGDGYDYLYETSNGNLVLTDTQLSTTETGTDSISEIERAYLYGRDDNNLIDASAVNNIKVTFGSSAGHSGDDTLKGGSNSDSFYPGQGNDSIVGGDGYDYVYKSVDGDTSITSNEIASINDGNDGIDSISQIEKVSLFDKSKSSLLDASTVSNMEVALYGGEGNDTILGGNLNDFLHPDQGNDLVFGGNGFDTLSSGGGGNLTLTDSQLTIDDSGINSINQIESVQLYGSNDDNSIDASLVKNMQVYVYAYGGKDILKGGKLKDTLNGADGEDTITGNGGNDYFYGGNGNDRLVEISNGDLVLTNSSLTTAQTGTDSLNSIENVTLSGRADNNLIDGAAVTSMKLTLQGSAGDDTLLGGLMSDTLNGGAGNDLLEVSGGDDSIIGGAGNDRLIAQSDLNMVLTNTKFIGDSEDSIRAIEQADLIGGSGDNLIDASGSTRIKAFGKGNDGDDTLKGGSKNDTLNGGAGNDILLGRAGNDTFIGGDGVDRLYEKGDRDFVLTDNELIGNGNDSISGVEVVHITGGSRSNVIDASGTTQIETHIFGDDGNDRLIGGAKDDIIDGGDGNNTLIGNDGADVFAIGSTTGRDTIVDFEDGVDFFGLDVFASFGSLNINNNTAGTAAIIRDLSQNNQLVAVVQDVDANDITLKDFTNI